VKPAPFAYERAESLDDALSVLGSRGAEVDVLAGGQSLVPLLNMRERRPELVLDITRIRGLDGIVFDDGAMTVGALVTQFDLGEHAGIDDVLRECLPYTGHYATRHRGTIGGSIAYGEPRGELPLALLTLGGSARVRSATGERDLAALDLYVGPYRTSLQPDELVVSTRWPCAAAGEGRAFVELAQRHGDFTLASAACAVTVSGGEIVSARVGVGAVADRPLLVPDAARALIGRSADAAAADAAGAATRAAVGGYDDHLASAAYRSHLAGVLVTEAASRAVSRAMERAGG
jgi:aerobic carbon-monoxide dehydrogenase medium subunit